MYTVSNRVAHVLMDAFEYDEAQLMQLVKALGRLGIYIVDGNDLSATAHYEITGIKGES
jgi:hypothetical protein